MILIIAVIVFLFTLYALSVDDFVFMRRNISLITLFDVMILSGLLGLFFSRLAYASLHPSFAYFNPLVFFVVPYFPGLSLSGFLLGGSLAAYLFTIKQKLPTGRIFDVISLSLFPSAGVLFAWEGVREIVQKNIFLSIVYGIAAILFAVSFIFLKRLFAKSSWKDGSVAITSLAIFSFLQLVIMLVSDKFKTIPMELPIFLFFLCTLFISFLIKQFRRAGER